MRVTFGFLPGLDSIPTSPSSLNALSPFHFCCLVMPKSESPLVVRVMASFPSSIILNLKTSHGGCSKKDKSLEPLHGDASVEKETHPLAALHFQIL